MKWAKLPFERAIEYVHFAHRILIVSAQGLGHITNMPALSIALANLEKETKDAPYDEDVQQQLDRTKEMALFAESEIENDFHTLHAHTVVAIWGALEVLVNDLAITFMLNEPATLDVDLFSKIKIRLSDYEKLDKPERMEYILTEYSRNINIEQKQGIGQFECVMKAIGLGGDVDVDVRKTLLEMSEVRNLLVHKASIVDNKFKKSCPWVELKIGDKLLIGKPMYNSFNDAVHKYILCLINRVLVHFGKKPYV